MKRGRSLHHLLVTISAGDDISEVLHGGVLKDAVDPESLRAAYIRWRVSRTLPAVV